MIAATSGIVVMSMQEVMTAARTQETLRFMRALGRHMRERRARRP